MVRDNPRAPLPPMHPFIRMLFAATLAVLAIYFYQEAKAAAVADPDSTPILLFAGMVLVGAMAGLIATTLLPKIGESIGNFFFHPNEQIEKNPHSAALGALACGDYERAVREYEAVVRKNPDDTLALSEIARIYCEKLHSPEHAAAVLEQAIERDLLPEDAAFLCARLADVYWIHQHDISKARELLLQVIETMPNTRHAANASHRLQEIERQLVMQS